MVVAGGGKKFSPVCKNNRNPVCRSSGDPGVWDRSFLGCTHFLTEAAGPSRLGNCPRLQRECSRGSAHCTGGCRQPWTARRGPSGVGRVWTACHSGPCRAVDRHPAPRPPGTGFLFPFCSSPIFSPPPPRQARNVRSQQQARDRRHLHSTTSVTVTLEIR